MDSAKTITEIIAIKVYICTFSLKIYFIGKFFTAFVRGTRCRIIFRILSIIFEMHLSLMTQLSYEVVF